MGGTVYFIFAMKWGACTSPDWKTVTLMTSF